jgi:hypothetical protein
MVAFEDAFINGFTAGNRFLSGEALIAHEIGHTLAPLTEVLDLSSNPRLYLLREIQASTYGAGIEGLSVDAKAQLLQDAINVTDQYLRRF